MKVKLIAAAFLTGLAAAVFLGPQILLPNDLQVPSIIACTHFSAYFAAYWIARAYLRQKNDERLFYRPRLEAKIAIRSFLIALGLAALDEGIQTQLANRHGSLDDFVVNASGALLALIIDTRMIND